MNLREEIIERLCKAWITKIEFDEKNKIVLLKEFQSKLPNYRPYISKII